MQLYGAYFETGTLIINVHLHYVPADETNHTPFNGMSYNYPPVSLVSLQLLCETSNSGFNFLPKAAYILN